MEPGFIPPFDKVTSVSVVAFTECGEMVATEDKRGIDLPGGHVAEGEDSCEQTARREALEEAGITMLELSFLRAIESDLYGSEPDQLTYMVIMTGVVDMIVADPQEGTRRIISVDEFKAGHQSLRMSMIHDLVDAACAATFHS